MKDVKNKVNTYTPITCHSSGKVRFETYQEANLRAIEISRNGNSKMKAYYCEDCNGYHLTTLNKSDEDFDEYWNVWKRNNN